MTVNSTASFIEAAKRIHGDRYDYSAAQWNGSGASVVVICRVCGPFNIRADSHYRRGCGCRACNLKGKARRLGQLQICPYCREWAKYRRQAACCPKCRDRHRQAKQLSRLRTCTVCGCRFAHQDKRRKYCSEACRESACHANQESVPCGWCGKARSACQSFETPGDTAHGAVFHLLALLRLTRA